MAAVTEPSAALPGHLSRCPLLPHRVSIRSPRCVLRDIRAAGFGANQPVRHRSVCRHHPAGRDFIPMQDGTDHGE